MTTATRLFSRRGALALGLALLAAACAKSPSELDGQLAGGAGGAGAATPGSAQDFVVNVGDRVFFDTDSTSLNTEAQTVLGRQAQWLALYPNYTVTVEGHADERGTREYNLALGARRAKAAQDFLVARGVAGTRIRTISYGKERPVALCDQDSCWAQNRRAVTVLNTGG
ncbi:peptidoglycan-associated lipoprotein Pal [Pleomorphomonas sp. NRK KF1]|uniref:peptidoglycan-associated lipoprotein Pal n=1 Tax=Pleomorphomonas sp. NRK KF1 TaxID=2943000 RepID=UPI002044A96A|nr:peptidoglycan-associated lipoprotein Pal [Pleomorphomonas sp. NRK KF1]MCM5554904.1 peptidoglycan-associated lipoprotein Pal [Pleomorphomonas sp. NRK KF1]